MSYLEIEKVIGREIIDSRGNPTVEAEVWLRTAPWAGARPPAAHPPASLRHWELQRRR